MKPAQRKQKDATWALVARALIGLAAAACSSREVPPTWPEASPASPAAESAPAAVVTSALDAHPPLPGESTSGWAGLLPDPVPTDSAAHSEHADHEHADDEHAGNNDAPQNAEPATQAVAYTCPMHPDVVSDRPGRCPRCGMTLVERDAPKK